MGKNQAPRLMISLTEDIIQNSKQRDSSHCMIATGVRAAFPEALRVAVDIQTIRFSDPAKSLRYTYLTPRVAQEAIIDFDQGVTPEPFTFQLRQGQVTRSKHRLSDSGSARQLSTTEKDSVLAMLADGYNITEAARAHECARSTVRRIRDRKALSLPQLVDPSHGTPGIDGGSVMPIRTGGRTPPLSNFARRRQFGLRALDR